MASTYLTLELLACAKFFVSHVDNDFGHEDADPISAYGHGGRSSLFARWVHVLVFNQALILYVSFK